MQRPHGRGRMPIAGQVHEGGQQVHQRHVRGHARGRKALGHGHDQRHAHRRLVKALLEPHATLAQHLAVVAAEHHHGVLIQAGFFQHIQNAADLFVHVIDHAVVSVAGAAHLFGRDAVNVLRVGHVQPLAVFVLVFKGNGWHARVVNVLVAVQIPMALRGHKGRVRVGVRDGQKKRFVLWRTRQVVQALRALVFHLVVVVDLHAAHARAGFQHRAHAHPGGTVGRALEPVGRPSKVGGVNVSGQAFFKAMQLVGADEVHLAAQNGAVADVAQVVRHGRHGSRKFAGVVVSGNRMRQAA